MNRPDFCTAALVPHDATSAKAGKLHCYECGSCFLEDGVTPREGVEMVCTAQAPVEEAVPTAPEPVNEPEGEKVVPLSRMNKPDLLARAAELGLTFDERVTVQELREALATAGEDK